MTRAAKSGQIIRSHVGLSGIVFRPMVAFDGGTLAAKLANPAAPVKCSRPRFKVLRMLVVIFHSFTSEVKLPCHTKHYRARPFTARPYHTAPSQEIPAAPCLSIPNHALPNHAPPNPTTPRNPHPDQQCRAKPFPSRPSRTTPCHEVKPRPAAPGLTLPISARPNPIPPRLECKKSRLRRCCCEDGKIRALPCLDSVSST